MGFLTCDRAGGAGPGKLRGTGVRLRIPADRMAAVPADAGRVVIGVRPEHFIPVPPSEAEKKDCLIEGVVEVVEPLGAEQHVLVNVGDASITVKRPREDRLARDDKVALTVDPARVHFFDHESSRAYR
jgi:multiple sugar transport system ATP-binding protein